MIYQHFSLNTSHLNTCFGLSESSWKPKNRAVCYRPDLTAGEGRSGGGCHSHAPMVLEWSGLGVKRNRLTSILLRLKCF